jgi:Putative peptidoglycan binding domain
MKYWEDAALNLFFKTQADLSVDTKGGEKYGKTKVNAPETHVFDVQTDLATLGYLDAKDPDGAFGNKSKRAITRFQRHAARLYRVKDGKPDDIAQADAFAGGETGICDTATGKELHKWIEKNWKLPIGRFKLAELSDGKKAREDIVEAWKIVAKKVIDAGGVLAPIDEANRSLGAMSAGSSGRSFHFAGRAIDIHQAHASEGKTQRYFIVKEVAGTDVFWRIWCKTEKDDGTQGVKKAKGEFKCWSIYGEKEYDIKEGHYFDMTALLESEGTFERIKARAKWNDKNVSLGVRNLNTEWWHFQYAKDKQKTFLDEMELVGHSEADLMRNIPEAFWKSQAKAAGRPEADGLTTAFKLGYLDGPPG